MAKYIVKEWSTVLTTYEVEAESAEKAEEALYDGMTVKEIDSERSDVSIESIEERTPENTALWLKNGEHDKLKEEDYIK